MRETGWWRRAAGGAGATVWRALARRSHVRNALPSALQIIGEGVQKIKCGTLIVPLRKMRMSGEKVTCRFGGAHAALIFLAASEDAASRVLRLSDGRTGRG